MTRPSSPRHAPEGHDAAFVCAHCGEGVSGSAPGTVHRNHCPHCLWSLHVDLLPGDRRAGCRGDMEPVAVATAHRGEWALVHRCRRCGLMRLNRIGGDDNAVLLISMALRPLANPPFPLDGLGGRVTAGAGEGRP